MLKTTHVSGLVINPKCSGKSKVQLSCSQQHFKSIYKIKTDLCALESVIPLQLLVKNQETPAFTRPDRM